MSVRELLAKNAAANGKECPFCGAREGIEWNGSEGVPCVYACHGATGCGEQWDADEYRLTEDEPECTCKPGSPYLCLSCERKAEEQDIHR